jgi:hypothetical protein
MWYHRTPANSESLNVTKINYERDELRLIDDAKKRRKQKQAEVEVLKSSQGSNGFLDDQDAMGSALSVLQEKRPELVFGLAKAIDHAFVHNDLSVLKKCVSATRDPNERSICLRILNGTLTSHKFVFRQGQIELERRDKLEWRKIGIHALRENLRLFHASNGKQLCFSKEFEAKYASDSY